jgi:hypothetical protein
VSYSKGIAKIIFIVASAIVLHTSPIFAEEWWTIDGPGNVEKCVHPDGDAGFDLQRFMTKNKCWIADHTEDGLYFIKCPSYKNLRLEYNAIKKQYDYTADYSEDTLMFMESSKKCLEVLKYKTRRN